MCRLDASVQLRAATGMCLSGDLIVDAGVRRQGSGVAGCGQALGRNRAARYLGCGAGSRIRGVYATSGMSRSLSRQRKLCGAVKTALRGPGITQPAGLQLHLSRIGCRAEAALSGTSGGRPYRRQPAKFLTPQMGGGRRAGRLCRENSCVRRCSHRRNHRRPFRTFPPPQVAQRPEGCTPYSPPTNQSVGGIHPSRAVTACIAAFTQKPGEHFIRPSSLFSHSLHNPFSLFSDLFTSS